LAASGIGSRRECEQLIVEGRVEVDGQVVSELGACVDRQRQEIRVDGEPLSRPKLVYYAIHKPTGVVTTARDPAGRPRVIDLLPPGAGRVFPVGRLDLASEGLILATNDGLLANQLTHPRHGVHKTYEVQVAGHPEPDVLAQLRRGVHLAEGFAHAVHVRLKSHKKRSSILEMVLDEGRNREVRRLFARVGHKVQRLTRIAVGPIRLGDLPRGAVRKLSPEEVRKLKAAAANPAGIAPDYKPATSGRSPRAATGGRAPRPAAKRRDTKTPRPRAGAAAATGENRRVIGGERSQSSGAKAPRRRPRPPRRRPGAQDS
jgi:23S rRNA pseudouridine2605 synthase